MPKRPVAVLALALLAVVASGARPRSDREQPAGVSLTIESMTAGRVDSVEVVAQPARARGLRDPRQPDGAWKRTFVRATPVRLVVADSVEEVRVRVIGGARVRGWSAVMVHFGPAAMPQDRRGLPWGRDLTFRRVDGRWVPQSRVHPAEPTTD